MSLLSHRPNRGLANQLLVPLALALAVVLAIIGSLVTLDTQRAADDGLVSQARAIQQSAGPPPAPAKGKRPRGWPAALDRVAVAHGAHLTLYTGRDKRDFGTPRVQSPRTYR